MATRYDTKYLDGSALDKIQEIKEDAETLAYTIEKNGTSRENSLALTYLETAVFYATRHISLKHGVKD